MPLLINFSLTGQTSNWHAEISDVLFLAEADKGTWEKEEHKKGVWLMLQIRQPILNKRELLQKRIEAKEYCRIFSPWILFQNSALPSKSHGIRVNY